MSKKEKLQNKRQELKRQLQEVDADLNALHWESVYASWGDKLDEVESKISVMIDNKEISPYFGGEATSAYTHLLKVVGELVFNFRLRGKDVQKVLNECLPLMEGYHSSIDPNNKQ